MDKYERTAIRKNDENIVELTLETLQIEAREFCIYQESIENSEVYGITNGKAIGTYIEHEFKRYIAQKYSFEGGNSARGIDLPSEDILTDIKVTSAKQPQSSSPFNSARQKIYGLGHNILLFVYEKIDNHHKGTASFRFNSCAFVDKYRTGDFQSTKIIREILENNGNEDDLYAFFHDRNIPGDDIVYNQLAEEIMQYKPLQGYLTISNALQWRLQYRRIVNMDNSIEGVDKII